MLTTPEGGLHRDREETPQHGSWGHVHAVVICREAEQAVEAVARLTR